MADLDWNTCDGKPAIDGFESNFVTDSDAPDVEGLDTPCWYAACNRGEYGGKTPDREAARQAAINHQNQTGHGSGVMGPVNC